MNRISKQRVIAAVLSLGILSVVGQVTPALAQYPQKPVRLIVSAPAGTAPDIIIARLLGDKLDQALGQRVLIDNRPTAQGVVAVRALRESAPDGYTLGFLQAAAAVVTQFTYKEANYDIERDLETVSTVAYTPMLLVANTKAPAKTLADLLSVAKAGKPEAIAIGNPIRTSIPHLTAELLGQRAGVKFQQSLLHLHGPRRSSADERRHSLLHRWQPRR